MTAEGPKQTTGEHHGIGLLAERIIFGGRWLMAPLYVGLLLGLIVVMIKFVQAFVDIVRHIAEPGMNSTVLAVLELIDIVLLGNLIIIVIFSGYENFVSKINVAKDSEDRPSWMGKVDFSGLKIKLIGSLVAISVIGLLQDFLNPAGINPEQEKWRIAIHLTFVVSGVLFAVTDYIADKRAIVEISANKGELELKSLEEKAGLTPAQARQINPTGE